MLEAYVLGQLTDQEKSVVENNVERYPELRDELARVEDTQEKLLMRMAVNPPLDLKASILSQIDDEEIKKEKEPEPKPAPVVVMTPSPRVNLWKYATAACVALALVAGYLASSYHRQWQSSQSELKSLMAENEAIAKSYNTVNRRIGAIERQLKIIGNPSFLRVVMNGTETSPRSSASVYWNKSTSEVFINIHALKELAANEQFQLWAIVDGKPVDAGVFDRHIGAVIKMRNVPNASAFAVTVEPRGGSVNPTLSNMQTIGNI